MHHMFMHICMYIARKALVAVHKHYGVPEWRAFATEHPECLPYLAVSAGTSQAHA